MTPGDTSTATRSQRLLERGCLERLGDASRSGLAETILIASVQHRFRDELGAIGAGRVRKVLRGLEANGRVAHSAGRWRWLR